MLARIFVLGLSPVSHRPVVVLFLTLVVVVILSGLVVFGVSLFLFLFLFLALALAVAVALVLVVASVLGSCWCLSCCSGCKHVVFFVNVRNGSVLGMLGELRLFGYQRSEIVISWVRGGRWQRSGEIRYECTKSSKTNREMHESS